MSNYRRNYVAGGTYFFTVVTLWRRPILVDDLARACLRNAIEKIRGKRHFEIGAKGKEPPRTKSRSHRGERAIWQRRFWEHTIDDEDDLKRCVDYVHWNPKKHGLVASDRDWRWSTFQRFVELGEYTSDWGREDPTPGFDTPEWAHFTKN